MTEWTSLEPNPDLAGQIGRAAARGALPAPCRVAIGTFDDIDAASCYDTILYINVLEHIAEDAAELAKAAVHLAPRDHLVVLAPADQFLYSAFGAAIGHHRRYDGKSLAAPTAPGCRLRLCRMLDAAGFFASLANAVLLRRAVAAADRYLGRRTGADLARAGPGYRVLLRQDYRRRVVSVN